MKLAALVDTSHSVGATRSRNAKRDALAACLLGVGNDEVLACTSYLAGVMPQGRIGIGPAILRQSARVPPASAPSLEIRDIDTSFDALKAIHGKGSAERRRELLEGLFRRATDREQDFLIRLVVGEVRQGALEGVMVEAIAKAFSIPASDVRRAYMLTGDIAKVSRIAKAEGQAGLARVTLQVGTPIQSMLAQPAEGIIDVYDTMDEALLDLKMDGARVQVHKGGGDVAVFSRRLNDVSASVPEVVEAVRAMPSDQLILDGEVLAMDPDGHPHPFQTTMRRFGRTQDVAALRESLPLSVYFFDCIHADGEDLIGETLTDRLDHLDRSVPEAHRMPRMVGRSREDAARFAEQAFAMGHEGIMAKAPDSLYEAGNRGRAWLKIKQSHTLDLVVLGAEWGTGRRRGYLSNLHLGAWDEVSGGFVMLGKTFKGLTDQMLEWQTKALQEIEVSRDAHTVYVEPKLVVEIAFNDVQTSPQYPGGMALRFARVKQYRHDKSVDQADTLAAVRALHPGE